MRKRTIFCFGLLLFTVVITSGLTDAQSITQGYDAEADVQTGMIVGIVKDNPGRVQAVNTETATEAHGVVVDSNDSPATLSENEKRVFVATAGRYEVLVSEEKGRISAGDYVAISSIKGVGMRAEDTDPMVAGKALEEFNPDAADTVISRTTVSSSDGSSRELRLGRILIEVSVKRNPFEKKVTAVPEFLKQAGEAVAGKSVSPARIYLSLAVLLIASAIAASIIYSAIRSSLISIGRNPLGKQTIVRSMLQVVLIGFTIFVTGMLGVYLLLRL